MKNQNRKEKSPKYSAGFSFLEVMIVVAILAGLAAIIGPAIFQRLDSAKGDQTRIQIRSVENALELFYLDNGRYPGDGEGLDALIENPGGLDAWNGPYLKGGKKPADAWKRDFNYSSEGGGSFIITSFGGDGQSGGDGSAADITN